MPKRILEKLKMCEKEDLFVWSSTDTSGTQKSPSETLGDWLVERTKDFLEKISDKNLRSKIFALKADLIDLLEIAKEYSFQGIDMNGFSSLVDYVIDFMAFALEEDRLSKADSISEVQQVIEMFQILAQFLKGFHEKRRNNKLQPYNTSISTGIALFSRDWEESATIFEVCQRLESHLDLVFEKFFGFWVRDATKSLLMMAFRILAFTYLPFPSCLRAYDDRLVHAVHRQVFKNSSKELPIQGVCIFDTNLMRKFFDLVSREANVAAKTFDAPSQGRWTIPERGFEVVENAAPIASDRKIRCRFLFHHSDPNVNRVLVFFCHGGGFAFMAPESHEIYAKPLIAGLEGAALLCPDYTLKAAYPVQFQDALDVYLWVTSGHKSVAEQLGFHPEKIVLIGDSAGATLGLGLVDVAKKIQTIDPSLNLLLPKDLVFFYGAYMLHSCNSPSKISSFFDILVTESSILAIKGIFAGVQGSEPRKNRPKNRLLRLFQGLRDDIHDLSYLLWARNQEPWYRKNGGFDCEAIRTVLQPYDNSFSATILNFDFERFSDTRLYLFTTNKCCFLDDNIDLARLWKGPVELHVAKRLVHGFLGMPIEVEAGKFAIAIVKKAVKNAVKN